MATQVASVEGQAGGKADTSRGSKVHVQQVEVTLSNKRGKLVTSLTFKEKLREKLHIKPYNKNIYDHIQCSKALL